jgi:hypothetical protein
LSEEFVAAPVALCAYAAPPLAPYRIPATAAAMAGAQATRLLAGGSVAEKQRIECAWTGSWSFMEIPPLSWI